MSFPTWGFRLVSNILDRSLEPLALIQRAIYAAKQHCYGSNCSVKSTLTRLSPILPIDRARFNSLHSRKFDWISTRWSEGSNWFENNRIRENKNSIDFYEWLSSDLKVDRINKKLYMCGVESSTDCKYKLIFNFFFKRYLKFFSLKLFFFFQVCSHHRN